MGSVLSRLVRTVHSYVGRSVVLERLETCGMSVLSVIQNRHMLSHPRLQQVRRAMRILIFFSGPHEGVSDSDTATDRHLPCARQGTTHRGFGRPQARLSFLPAAYLTYKSRLPERRPPDGTTHPARTRWFARARSALLPPRHQWRTPTTQRRKTRAGSKASTASCGPTRPRINRMHLWLLRPNARPMR